MRAPVHLVGLAILGIPLAASGQDDSPLPATGQYALSFAVPEGGGGGIGVRKIISATTNLGLDVTLDWNWSDFDRPTPLPDEEPRNAVLVGVSPNVRLYRGDPRQVMPFISLATAAEYANGPEDAWAFSGRGEVGIGAEWFATDAVSLSANTGVRISYSHNSGQGSSVQTIDFSAFRSALLLNLFF